MKQLIPCLVSILLDDLKKRAGNDSFRRAPCKVHFLGGYWKTKLR